MKKRNFIFLTAWLLIIVVLILISLKVRTADDAIVAVVEPQKVTISFPKAVKLNRIKVVPGQKVNPGDTLFLAERPNLVIDIDKTQKSLNSLNTELANLEIKSRSELKMTNIEKKNKLNDIDREIEQIQSQIDYNRRRLEQLKSLSEQPIRDEPTDSPATLKLKALKEERAHRVNYYDLIIDQIKEKQRSETELIKYKIDQLEQEMKILRDEEMELIQIAKNPGTVGNVYVQTDEVVAPYTNIISVYENDPRVIKAFLNEDNKYPVEVGSKVMIESSNREYKVDGEIIEIGSRIVDYPDRLLNFPDQELYGQEIFIRITGESNFLNGEKVYVSVLKK